MTFPPEQEFLDAAEAAAHSRDKCAKTFFWRATRGEIARWLREEPWQPAERCSYFNFEKSWQGHLDELRAVRRALWQGIRDGYKPNETLPLRTPFK